MGILNVTPDSFYSGSRKKEEKEILSTVEQMLLEGAFFLDLGGYSSRPGADDISTRDEINRAVPAIELILKEFPQAFISIDTFRAEVAKRAVEAGAVFVNDISAGQLDEEMIKTVAEQKVPYIAMHMRGTPQTMKSLTNYDDILKDIMQYFSGILKQCREFGIEDVMVDPGFGFAKTAAQSFEILNKLEHFRFLECPLLIGVSRKSMIYRTLSSTAEEALNGTTVLNTLALVKGVSILRVHDVKEAVEAVKLVDRLN